MPPRPDSCGAAVRALALPVRPSVRLWGRVPAGGEGQAEEPHRAQGLGGPGRKGGASLQLPLLIPRPSAVVSAAARLALVQEVGNFGKGWPKAPAGEAHGDRAPHSSGPCRQSGGALGQLWRVAAGFQKGALRTGPRRHGRACGGVGGALHTWSAGSRAWGLAACFRGASPHRGRVGPGPCSSGFSLGMGLGLAPSPLLSAVGLTAQGCPHGSRCHPACWEWLGRLRAKAWYQGGGADSLGPERPGPVQWCSSLTIPRRSAEVRE